MENLVDQTPLCTFYRDRPVLVTGHTGFKGSWLSIWLQSLGAKVAGLSLPPDQDRLSLFESTRLSDGMVSHLGDIRDLNTVLATIEDHAPEVIFHLAAQSLVRHSYEDPIETFGTNIQGTVHVLEAARRTRSVRSVIIVTSDKCYENQDWDYGYREIDQLGGSDPYSASKGAAELVTESYRRSFFGPESSGSTRVGIASARAGNVIGGGDWADDRLIPDCVRALTAKQSIAIRNPSSIRPWQHVLEPLSGYLWLANRLHGDPERFSSAWNFGPHLSSTATVREIVRDVVDRWEQGDWREVTDPEHDTKHEARTLRLDCTKASIYLNWEPVWELSRAIGSTVDWYRHYYLDDDFNAREFCQQQIQSYSAWGAELNAPWAVAIP